MAVGFMNHRLVNATRALEFHDSGGGGGASHTMIKIGLGGRCHQMQPLGIPREHKIFYLTHADLYFHRKQTIYLFSYRVWWMPYRQTADTETQGSRST